ncbi:tetraspanin-6-like [Nematolebias whitei]|uniref:tetraspanin-6-like n=1 Tax=Nematolebias whitei TaxID=451745 RepID=UPI00189C04D3|nr:tetraspanin-6-like [Nematolebias whitei]
MRIDQDTQVILILMVGLALFAHGYLLNDEQVESTMGLHFIYGFSAITLIFLIFGGFGAWKEKKWALITFAVGMILICLYLLAGEIFFLVLKPKIEEILKDSFYTFLPIANATQSHLDTLNYTQVELQCCGVESYMDWENNIPGSCLCVEDSANPCMDAPRDSNLFIEGQTIKIYSEPCLPLIIQRDLQFLQILTGIRVGMILLWVLAIGLCVAILCQINKKLETPKVVYSSEAKAGKYSCLTETYDSCPT